MPGALAILHGELEVRKGRQPALHHKIRMIHGLEVGEGGVVSPHHEGLVTQEIAPFVDEVEKCKKFSLLRGISSSGFRQPSSSVGNHSFLPILDL